MKHSLQINKKAFEIQCQILVGYGAQWHKNFFVVNLAYKKFMKFSCGTFVKVWN